MLPDRITVGTTLPCRTVRKPLDRPKNPQFRTCRGIHPDGLHRGGCARSWRDLCNTAAIIWLLETSVLTGEELNIAGIRSVLQLEEETRALQVEIARLRGLADGAGDPGHPAPVREPKENPGSLSR